MEHKPRFYGDFGKPFTNKDVFVTFFRRKYKFLTLTHRKENSQV